MWRKQDEGKPSSTSPGPGLPSVPEQPRTAAAPPAEAGSASGNLSQSIKIKGEITGREDLYIDGEVQGSVRLTDGCVTVGPNGRVTAEIEAREIVVGGKVSGTLRGRERVQIGRSGQVIGDVVTRRIMIEEGAILRGKVDVGAAEEPRAARAAAVATANETPRRVPVQAPDLQK